MADSLITKRALASALKELMTETAFDKISVADICGRCGMNRKSFYYHFRDKYDLVNWIYDTEFITFTRQKTQDTFWDFFVDLCHYIDENRVFYKHALQIKGQNSFSDHLSELLQPILREYLGRHLSGTNNFQVIFFADACICAIKRWILDLEDMDAGEFLSQIATISQLASSEIPHLNG